MGDKVVPLLAAVVVLLGVWRRVPVYDVFVRGAKEGIKTAASIAPFLIAILPAAAQKQKKGAQHAR